MENLREHKNGIIGTVIFHGILLLMLLLMGFFTPLPLPGEEGILVNFVDSETGLGEMEPSPIVQQEEPTQSSPEEVAAVTPPPPANPEPSKQEIVTQDVEQTAAIEAARKKREEERLRQAE